MGPQLRRKIVISSDEEDEEQAVVGTSSVAAKDERTRSQKSSGKLKSVSTNRRLQPPRPETKPKKPATNKSITAFFNSTTQRQFQGSQSSVGSQKHEEIDAIRDDSDENEAPVPLSKASTVALALRKRKLPSQQASETDASVASRKFRKTSGGRRTPFGQTDTPEDRRPWVNRFAPADLSELAVHKRKVQEVRQWLDIAYRNKRQKVLVLKGPAGSGKTTTVKLLAAEMGVNVLEWRDPVNTCQLVKEESFSEQFEDFLRRGATSPGLTLCNSAENCSGKPAEDLSGSPAEVQGRNLLLIEEFPDISSRTSNYLQSFRSAIQQYVSALPVQSSPTPLVMVISEVLLSGNTAASDSFTMHRLLGPELMHHPYINTIEFNPVAKTYIGKALELVISKEAQQSGRRKSLGQVVIKHLAEGGDIRSAVSSLELVCGRSDVFKTSKEVLALINHREASLGIFHAIGKVVHNKRTEASVAQPPSYLPQHRRPLASEIDIDSLIDGLGTDTTTFIAGLHENHVLSASSVLESENCSTALSDADFLTAERSNPWNRATVTVGETLRQEVLSFHVAVRGLLFNLPYPVKRIAPKGSAHFDPNRIFYPSSLQIWKKEEEISAAVDNFASRYPLQEGERTGSFCVAKDELVTDYLPYLARIRPRDVENFGVRDVMRFNPRGWTRSEHLGLDDGEYEGKRREKKALSKPLGEVDEGNMVLFLENDDIVD